MRTRILRPNRICLLGLVVVLCLQDTGWGSGKPPTTMVQAFAPENRNTGHSRTLALFSTKQPRKTKTQPPKSQRQRRNARSTAPPSSKTPSYMDELLMEHNVLTKQEEQELGRAIQKADRLRKAMEPLVQVLEEQEAEQQQRHPQQQNDMIHHDDEMLLLHQQQQQQLAPDDNLMWGNNDNDIMIPNGRNAFDDSDDDDEDEDLANLSVYSSSDDGNNNNNNNNNNMNTNGNGGGYDDYEEYSWDATQIEPKSSSALIQGYEAGRTMQTSPSSNANGNSNNIKINAFDADPTSLLAWLDRISATALYEATNQTHASVRAGLVQGARARETLVLSNVRLVVSIAKQWARNAHRAQQGNYRPSAIYSGSWEIPSLHEAVQEGLIGLHKAVDRYQPQRNLRFATYATYWVTNSVRNCFRGASTIRLPTQVDELYAKYRTLRLQFLNGELELDRGKDGSSSGTNGNNNREPTLEEMAKIMGISVRRLTTVIRSKRPILSLDAPIASSGGGKSSAGKAGGLDDDAAGSILGNLIADDDSGNHGLSPSEWVDLGILRTHLEDCLSTVLAPHERDVVRLRLGLDGHGNGLTTKQVAEYLQGSLTQSQVRNTELRALKKLRSPQTLTAYCLVSFLDFANVDPESIQ